MDVAGFLARHPPFDALEPDSVARAAATVRIEYFPAGTVILAQQGEPSRFLYVVRSGAVELIDEGRVLDLLGEGEAFGHPSMLSGEPPTSTVRTHEDTICYLIPHQVAEEALATPTGLAFLGATLRERIVHAGERRAEPSDPSLARVGALVRRELVSCPPETTVAEAARTMAEHRVSALLIRKDGAWGILTDRDLRTRVLAAGLGGDVTVASVMTFPAATIPFDTMAAEVLLAMLEGGFHHFPVTDTAGQVIGVVTDTDLMGLERRSPFALKSEIERAPDVEAAVAAARELPYAVCALVDTGADPVGVGHVVGVTIDTLTRRLIELFVAERGEAPVPWAWLALGSAARHEQALHTDQDHAIAYEAGGRPEDDLDPWFAALGEHVTAGLEAAGIPRCNGDAMAANRALRRSVESWATAFRGWMQDPGVEGSVLTSIVFDYRRVAGPLDAEDVLDAVVRTAPAYPVFLRHLGRRALDASPPTGFFRDLVVEAKGEHAGTLDVKHRGITIVGNLARAWAIGSGLTEKGTLARLRAAAAAGRVDEETRAGLEEAFRALWDVRLAHHCRQVRAGRPVDDFVDPGALGPLSRRQMKEAFRIIARAQKLVAADLGVSPR